MYIRTDSTISLVYILPPLRDITKHRIRQTSFVDVNGARGKFLSAHDFPASGFASTGKTSCPENSPLTPLSRLYSLVVIILTTRHCLVPIVKGNCPLDESPQDNDLVKSQDQRSIKFTSQGTTLWRVSTSQRLGQYFMNFIVVGHIIEK